MMLQYKMIIYMTILFLIAYAPRAIAWLAPFIKQDKLVNTKKNRLALIIPARNEGMAVMPLFESIQNQTYDRTLFDVYVVVKEKEDPVHEYAKMIQATVLTDESQTCKGDCLDYALKSILKDKTGYYDAYLIVDADCMLAPDFMEEMNHAMASGAQVINAKKLVKNYYWKNGEASNMVTACNGLIWTLMDDMGNRYKSDRGYTTMTISTGILITADLVEKWGGWIYKQTLTEDMELQRDCGLQGYTTYYTSYAKFYMEEAPALSETNKRRKRWMTGLTDADKIYFPALIKKHSFQDLKNTYYLYCLWIVYAYIGGLVLLSMINLLIFAALVMLGDPFSLPALGIAMLPLAFVYLAFWIMTLFAIIIDWKYIRLSWIKKLALLFVHPLFYMQYIGIVAKAIFWKSSSEWEVIDRVEVN